MLRKWTDWLNVAAAVFLGAYLFLLGLCNGTLLAEMPEALGENAFFRSVAFFVGLALLLGNALLLWRACRAGGLRENLRLAAPDGANLLAPDALEQLFRRSLKELPDLRHPRVALEVKSGTNVALHLRFGLREQPDVVKRLEEVKTLVRERFRRMLPEGVNLEIFVEVVDFVADGAPAPVREPEKEFDGPVYSDESGGQEGGPVA